MSAISPRRAEDRALRCGGAGAGRGVLAGPADAGAAEGGRLRGGRSRHRRARHRRGAHPRPPGRARHPARLRRAGGGAVGQSLGPRLADHGGACARRSRRPHRPDRRRRRRSRSASNRPLSDASTSRCCCGPAACRARTSSACSAARWRSRRRMPRATAASRWRRACWPRITRRARACGSMPISVEPGEALLAFGPRTVARRGTPRRSNESVGSRAISRKPPPIFSAIFVHSTPQRRARDRRDADPRRRIGRSHQRPAAPRRGRT